MKTRGILITSLLSFLAIGSALVATKFLDEKSLGENEPSAQEIADITEVEEPETPEEETFALIDFQPIVDEWAGSVSGHRSVLMYDIENDTLVGSYNPEEAYSTASLYKLFVVYEGYRRIENGQWSANDYAGSTGRTILDCLDLAIRESYSPCAETLWSMIGHAELDRIISEEFGITNSNISGLTSNPFDILAIMKLFYTHPDFNNEELVARMKDSFLNQPITTYNWRQGLPSGFSSNTNVYNKVGWDWGGTRWNIYHDAAIIEFPEQNRHYIVVVMTNFVSHTDIARLGSMTQNHFLVSAEEL